MQTRDPTTVLSGRYALEEELGRSGTGMAWRATDRLLGRTVTVKLIHPRLGDNPVFAGRLAEQARLVVSLSSPGLVPLFDSGEQDGVPYLVREHVDGVSARARLERTGPLAPGEAARIGVSVLEALAPAHDAGVLHLHLDLDDVLLTPDGGVRVTDLGIGQAVAASRPPAEAAEILGGGVAPELAGDGPVDRRADVYEVGALVFELLTGEPPAGRRSPRATRSDVPRPLDRIVERALAPDPGERFESAPAFARALSGSVVTDRVEDDAPRRWLGAWLAAPLAVAAVAAAIIVGGLWFGRLEVGGPLGIRPVAPQAQASTPPAAPVARTLRPIGVAVLDPPPGDGSENGSNAPLTLDGDPATAWRSENYFDGRLNKPGVGLVFDLGETRDVVGFRLSTPHPGFVFQLAVGDDPEGLVAGIGGPITAGAETRGTLEASGRYVLVWITTVVPVEDGNRAEIAEFRPVVLDDA